MKKLIIAPALLWFMTHQVMMPTPGVMDVELNGHTQFKDAFKAPHKNSLNQLQYVQTMDHYKDVDAALLAAADGLSFDDTLWNCKKVTAHRMTRHNNSTQLEVKVSWNDINKSASWVDMNALALQDPLPIFRYAVANHITNTLEFKLLVKYLSLIHI